jgi:hypothetical protein
VPPGFDCGEGECDNLTHAWAVLIEKNVLQEFHRDFPMQAYSADMQLISYLLKRRLLCGMSHGISVKEKNQ